MKNRCLKHSDYTLKAWLNRKMDDLLESSPHLTSLSDSGQSFKWQQEQFRLIALMTLVLSNFMGEWSTEEVTIDSCFQLEKWTDTFRWWWARFCIGTKIYLQVHLWAFFLPLMKPLWNLVCWSSHRTASRKCQELRPTSLPWQESSTKSQKLHSTCWCLQSSSWHNFLLKSHFTCHWQEKERGWAVTKPTRGPGRRNLPRFLLLPEKIQTFLRHTNH